MDASARTPAKPPVSSALLGALFFGSGALALVYEVVWHRQFSILFGSVAPATAVVLAAYMAGLGIGSLAAGRWSGRWPKPLRVYGLIEIGIGLTVLASEPVASFLSGTLLETVSGSTSLLAKGSIAFAAIALPTMAMGATLPVLAELVDLRKDRPGMRVGWLYMVNTTGAALGALLFPFLLLPSLGMAETIYACAGANILIGGVAIGLSRNVESKRARPAETRAPAERGSELPWPLGLGFISGAATFILQVLWNRAFAQIHENSIFSFALIVAVFIAAIAVGAEIARTMLRRGATVRSTFWKMWAAGGFAVAISPILFVKLSDGLDYLPASDFGFSWRLLGLVLTTVLVPVALLTAAMPLLFEDAVRGSDRSTGDRVGVLLAANIAGAISGALLAGFVLPSTLGMWRAVMATGISIMLLSALLRLKRARDLAFAGVAFGLSVWLANGFDLPRTRVDKRGGEKLLALSEGWHGIVAVSEKGQSRRLKLNNHYVLGGTASIGDERMQAHLPLLVHPNPERVAFLGYGTGISAGGIRFHPGATGLGIELVPEVAEFATRHFGEANLEFGQTPETRLIVDDARTYLRGRNEELDVIIGDLVVPWRPGESSLYTKEHFENVRAALKTGGLACVWLPLFQLSEAQFRIVLNTFLEVFPTAQVWRGDFSPSEPALALIAYRGPADLLEPQKVSNRLEKMRDDPFNPHLRHPAAFWMHWVGLIERPMDGERRLNTEDLPWLELRGWAGETNASSDPFTGRKLQAWEKPVRERSRDVAKRFGGEAFSGWQAGAAMSEFTLLLSEGREAEASQAEARARSLLGERAAEAVFGR